MATQVNYTLAAATREDPPALAAVLQSDDSVELALRRPISHLYYSRTKHRFSTSRRLGAVPPGTASDPLPSRLVGDVVVLSTGSRQPKIWADLQTR